MHESEITKQAPTDQTPRRHAITKMFAVLFGGLITIVPFIPAFGVLLDPLLRKRRAVGPTGDAVDSEGFIKVGQLSQLQPGIPTQLPVIADLQDYWNRFPETSIGSVFLLRTGDDVQCFNARCPHLGCTVGYRPAEEVYFCPCHDSTFNVDGSRNNEIPPRNLDSLEVEVRSGKEVWVKFQNFRVGVHDKKAV